MTRTHKNIIIGFLGLLVIVFLLAKLSIKHDDSQWRCIKTKSLARLFEYAFYNQYPEYSDTISKMITDSIQKNENFVLSTIEVIDSVNNQIRLAFYVDTLFWDGYDIKKRNVFTINIDNHDTLLVGSEQIYSKDSLFKQIINFISNPLNNPYLPEKRFKNINYFGDYPVSQQFFYLRAQMVPDSLGLSTTWIKLFNTLNLIIDSYEQLRNELSLSKFKQHFNELNLNKKISISDIYPIRIYLFLDSKYVVIPQPPPLDQVDYIMDEIDIELNK